MATRGGRRRQSQRCNYEKPFTMLRGIDLNLKVTAHTNGLSARKSQESRILERWLAAAERVSLVVGSQWRRLSVF